MKQTTLLVALTAMTAGLHAHGTADAPAATEHEVHQLPTTVVTGDLWQSELQRTTASVSVIDQAQLDTNGVQHFGDIVNAIPNLTWTGGSSRPRFIQIRGIGENSQFEGETPDSAVRFLIDDLDLTGLGTVGNLFDVQQVEVLRGPQAGAFGANAAGGVIKIVTNDPTPYWTGQIEGSVGEDSLVTGGLAVGGPIIESDPETLTFRLALHQLNQNGFRHNKHLNKDNTNERDEFTSRLKLRWIANEDWQWDGTVLYADANNGYDEWSLENTRFDTYSDKPGRDRQESLAGAVRGTWTGLAGVNVTAITSATTTDSTNSYDSDWTYNLDPRTYDAFMNIDRKRDVFSQELRFDSVEQQDALGWIDRWTVGSYVSLLEEDSDVDYRDMWSSPAFPVLSDSIYTSDNYSLFGQIAHDFSGQTRLIIGLRAEYYDTEVESSGLYYGTELPNDTKSEDGILWGGKITLEHDLDDQHMVFGSITRGYKAGGANTAAFLEDGNPTTYDDETLYNFETGLRSEWSDAAFVSQITAFYLLRDDPQLRSSSGEGGFFNYFTSNGDKAEYYGLEAEATWYISIGWTASAGIGLLETENADNDDLSNAPAYTFSAQLNYQAENGFFVGLEARGSDQYYESNNPDNRDQRVRNSFVTFNGSIGYQYENWTFTVWGKNLFNEEYQKRIFYFANEAPDFDDSKRYENPADPQQFGMTVNYRW